MAQPPNSERALRSAPSFTPDSGGLLGTSALRVSRDGDRLWLTVAIQGAVREHEITREALRRWSEQLHELVSFARTSLTEPGSEIRSPYLLAKDAHPLVAVRCSGSAAGPVFALKSAVTSTSAAAEAPLELAEVDALIAGARAIADQR